MFQKLLRDLKPLGLDGCRGGRRARTGGRNLIQPPPHNEPLPREVFRTPPGREADEPPLSFHRRPRGAEPWHAGTVAGRIRACRR